MPCLKEAASLLAVASIHLARERPQDALRSAKAAASRGPSRPLACSVHAIAYVDVLICLFMFPHIATLGALLFVSVPLDILGMASGLGESF